MPESLGTVTVDDVAGRLLSVARSEIDRQVSTGIDRDTATRRVVDALNDLAWDAATLPSPHR